MSVIMTIGLSCKNEPSVLYNFLCRLASLVYNTILSNASNSKFVGAYIIIIIMCM